MVRNLMCGEGIHFTYVPCLRRVFLVLHRLSERRNCCGKIQSLSYIEARTSSCGAKATLCNT